jgi:ADP-ribosyl-[dinitrogen reductase] hydrolase
MDQRDRFRGCLLGLACGDAVGTAVEFQRRGSFAPVTDMVGGGPFRLNPGEWTDDTSMALCLAASLTELGRFDPRDQMIRYRRWQNEGYLSSNGRCFDIGNTIRDALQTFEWTGEPYSGSTDPRSAGNGCLMRLAPVPMFGYPDRAAAVHLSGESARTTHGATECIEASRLFGAILFQALAGADKDEILSDHRVEGLTAPGIEAIARGDYRSKSEDEIRGSGYVVESLEAALWCFWQAESFEEAILRAVNLGDDADTTAAICGQVAGAFYGERGIPAPWLERLVMSDEIGRLAEQLQAFRSAT